MKLTKNETTKQRANEEKNSNINFNVTFLSYRSATAILFLYSFLS